MPFPSIARYYIWIQGACLAALLIAILATIKAYVASKRAVYFFSREAAAIKAGRFALVTLLLVAVNVGMALQLPREAPRPMATPTLTLTPTFTPSPTFTPRPTVTPTFTLTPTSTPTPTPQLPTSARTPIPGALPPGPSASFDGIILAKGVTEDNLPVEPCTVFPKGTKRVYAFFKYSGMAKGVVWTQAWYKEGEEIWSHTKKWRLREKGLAWIFLESSKGLAAGEYEVRLYIGDKLQQKATFTVR